MWTLVVCPPPVCGVSRTEPGTWAVLQMCSRCCVYLVGSWFPVLPLMTSSRLMTPSKSSVPSQLLARWVGHAPPPLPHPTPPPQAFFHCLSLAGQKLPGAKALESQETLPNLENRVGSVALNQAAGDPLPFPVASGSGSCSG